jgi:hypothetical protein
VVIDMKRSTRLRFALLITVRAAASPAPAAGQKTPALPSPLSLADVVRIATERRDEILAARAFRSTCANLDETFTRHVREGRIRTPDASMRPSSRVRPLASARWS